MGCRVNQVETERLIQGGISHGFQPVEAGILPNLMIINTCSVTAESDRQTRQLVRRIVRENPQVQLVVTGCYAQGNAESLGKMPGVILVLGNSEKERLWDHLKQCQPATTNVCVTPVTHRTPMIDVPLVDHFSDRNRAFLQVQDGCDCHCTFCTIPALRGPSRSLSVAHILAQAQKYQEAGYREIVLTGINLGSYGHDLLSHPNLTLAHVIEEITLSMKQARLRLSSLDPNDLDEKLIEQFAVNPKMCPYLHLSIQSGDNTILKRMGRGYGRQMVLDRVKALRAVRPDMVFGADLIVGFPTETPEAFQNTLDLIGEAEISLLHVFRYSDRPGTPAAAIPKRFRVSTQEIRLRSEQTRQMGVTRLTDLIRRQVGKRAEVLVETLEGEYAQGKTAHFLPIQFPATHATKIGQLTTVTITGFDSITPHLFGEQ